MIASSGKLGDKPHAKLGDMTAVMCRFSHLHHHYTELRACSRTLAPKWASPPRRYMHGSREYQPAPGSDSLVRSYPHGVLGRTLRAATVRKDLISTSELNIGDHRSTGYTTPLLDLRSVSKLPTHPFCNKASASTSLHRGSDKSGYRLPTDPFQQSTSVGTSRSFGYRSACPYYEDQDHSTLNSAHRPLSTAPPLLPPQLKDTEGA